MVSCVFERMLVLVVRFVDYVHGILATIKSGVLVVGRSRNNHDYVPRKEYCAQVGHLLWLSLPVTAE